MEGPLCFCGMNLSSQQGRRNSRIFPVTNEGFAVG
jgi:hypothetical protein